MRIVGTTAIEDKLQENVKNTVEFMKRAGIKVWVLTGDKVGTAKMIGLATGLLEPEPVMKQHEIREPDKPNEDDKARRKELQEDLTRILDECKQVAEKNDRHKAKRELDQIQPQGIIVAGSSLVIIDGDEELRQTFLAAAILVDVVLACRVSPK